MYEGDTFFSLTMAARVGLVLLSMGLAAATAAAFIKITCRMVWLLRLFLALVYFGGFVWLSPQVFYLYYMTLFDDLVLHNVVQLPQGPLQIMHLLSFTGKAILSQHAAGLLGWGLIGLAALGERAVPSKRLRAVLGLQNRGPEQKTPDTLPGVYSSLQDLVLFNRNMSNNVPTAWHASYQGPGMVTWRPGARISLSRERPCPSSQQRQNRRTICL